MSLASAQTPTARSGKCSAGLARFVPARASPLRYDRGWLSMDIIGPEWIFPTVELTVRGMEAAAPIEESGQVAGDEVKQ
jgi:hypothetical protein